MLALPATPHPRFLVSAPRCRAERCSAKDDPACTYRVAWAINPHMRVGGAAPLRAVRQHGAFVGLLDDLGADIVRLPFVHGAYDSVFIKDSAVLMHRSDGDHALLSHPSYAERRAEQAARRAALEGRGFTVHSPPPGPLEGGDVVILPAQGGALMGYGFRSSRASTAALERFLDAPVLPLELREPHLYHLDMAVAVLHDGTALVCEDALTRESLRALRRACTGEVLTVSAEDARRFALNVVEVGRHLVLAGEFDSLSRALRRRGFFTHAVALSEFHNAGGSAACLVARVHSGFRSESTGLRSSAA